MDVSSVHCHSAISPFSRGSHSISTPCPTRRNPRRPFDLSIPVSPITFPHFTTSSLPMRRNYHVSSHSGRHQPRRNTLRRKLFRISQVRHNPIPLHNQNPLLLNNTNDYRPNPISSDSSQNPPESHKLEPFKSISRSNTVKQIANMVENRDNPAHIVELNRILSRPRVFFSKLNKALSQFWKESEFWGGGFRPIFVIFKDPLGKIERVKVNEDEIIRRCRDKSGYQEELKLKISYAKMLAKEMEAGNYVLPSKTSLTMVIDSGAKKGFSLMVPTVSIPSNLLPRVSIPSDLLVNISRIGVAVLCCSSVLWVVMKLAGNGKKLTNMEKMMLGRKVLARNEKKRKEEKMDVEVEVLPKYEKPPPTLPARRPRLDKQAVIRKIADLKGIDVKNFSSLSDKNSQNLTGGINSSSLTVKNEGSPVKNDAIDIKIEKIKSVDDRTGINNMHSGGSSKEVHDDKYTGVAQLSGTSKKPSIDLPDSKVKGPSSRVSKKSGGISNGRARSSRKKSSKKRGRIILSVEEARKYLAKRGEGMEKQEIRAEDSEQEFQNECEKMGFHRGRSSKDRIMQVVVDEYNRAKEELQNRNNSMNKPSDDSTTKNGERSSSEADDSNDKEEDKGDSSKANVSNDKKEDKGDSSDLDEELNSVMQKIFDGYRDNYDLARAKSEQGVLGNHDVEEMVKAMDDDGLDWMKDDHVREIVFQVRENELAGRKPFYAMDDEDKAIYFRSLEDQVEKTNRATTAIHEWFHANVANLDYDPDCISSLDQAEKSRPRWKGPPIKRYPEVDKEIEELKNAVLDTDTGEISFLNREEESASKSKEAVSTEKSASSSIANEPKVKNDDSPLKNAKTVIEGSDGSIKPGKKSAKEYWQHTKKWTPEFLDLYNRTTDPEAKAALRQMGQDLDRWMTLEEAEEAAKRDCDLPKKARNYIDSKTNRLKGEVERYGVQAVVSKYREYGDEKEDYLWWLDLPYVLSIQVGVIENGEPRVGLYMLEMAPDLKMEPKRVHIVAFEDAQECEHVCFIMQAYMSKTGIKGRCVPIPQHPKDVYQDTKEEGYGVSVMRKGDLVLNADMEFDQVEDMLIANGSKMYHDAYMKERGVDATSLMRGAIHST